ncbi:hypothetical protein L1276_003052 [Flavobacterium sp. HSC-32F16]|nr:hypothetical protein [Flavobacterium sp. HSC-32F16]
MIWIIDFFDIIFAEENLKIEFQITTMISKYNKTKYKMNFNYNIHTELLIPSSDLGFNMLVHHYRQ